MKILLVGLGALGASLYNFLSSEHEVVGIDPDIVDREGECSPYPPGSLGKGKAEIFNGIAGRFDESVDIQPYDLIIDATDSFENKMLVNRLCLEKGKDCLILGMSETHMIVFRPKPGKCYNCVFHGKKPAICHNLSYCTARRFASFVPSLLERDFSMAVVRDEIEYIDVPEIGCGVCRI